MHAKTGEKQLKDFNVKPGKGVMQVLSQDHSGGGEGLQYADTML